MNSLYSHCLYSDTPVPHFSDQPFQVFSTPGLGHFFNDFTLYAPVRYYGENVKEVEKQLDLSESGGFELNAPLIVQPLVKTQKKKKGKKTSLAKKKSSQKGHGKSTESTQSISQSNAEIEDALQHPVKVDNYNFLILSILCSLLGVTRGFPQIKVFEGFAKKKTDADSTQAKNSKRGI